MARGTIVQIWFEHEENGRPENPKAPPFRLIETDFEDFEAFLLAVGADKLICGDDLWTKAGDRGERIIAHRSPYAFRGSAVRRATLPTWRIVEMRG